MTKTHMIERCNHDGTHVFHAWHDPADAADAAATFLSGAEHRDACVFFGDELDAARLRNRLAQAAGPDRRPPDFVHIPPDHVFVGAGPSPIGSLLALRNRLATEALASARRVRIVVLPGAGATDDELRDRAEAFESMFIGHGQPPRSILALCLYDARRFPADMLELACAAHPLVFHDGRIVRNPLHDEPDLAAPGRVA